MIPTTDIETEIPSPLPSCDMPSADEISEEGFGGFRGTWWIGRVSVKDAESTIAEEGALITLIDKLASTPTEYEMLASAVEGQDLESLEEPLRAAALEIGLSRFVAEEEIPPLEGLEVGVAGLAYALAANGCLTAASCRSHIDRRSWSDYPVVVFAAPAWRVEILAGLVASESCGIASEGRLLAVYGASILETHNLAKRILEERRLFRKMPEHWDRRRKRGPSASQPSLFPADPPSR
jgi:hypothetical protein